MTLLIRTHTACALACVMLLSARAEAAPDRVLVIPFAGEIPDAPDGAARLTQVAARSAGLTGGEVTVSEVALPDALMVVGCVDEDAACMEQLAATFSADVVVIGRIESAGDGLALTVKVYRAGAISKAEYPLRGGDLEALVEELAGKLPDLFLSRRPPPEPEPAAEPAPAPAPLPPAAPPPSDRPAAGFSLGRVGWAPLLVTGAGAALAGGGAVFLVRAGSRQDQVDGAAVGTADDLDRLEELENEGARFAQIGNVLTIAGGLAVAAGVTWAVLRARSGPSTVSVAPVPVRGGAAVLLEVNVP